uniref:Uncharacterized protein AlNc14C135G7074 n=1 Tax=Albugo laibachii Nc14 TaxID=890382 RepID=F0W6J2_9STRA|nr:conserved hypothetical protein [Albugo laibachii Nc14]CCA21840.1 conserved hypothetical protein [Albugo laibachii Nc14]|eukprot:CCA21840.1 conserved hypothetical protein [Albugo laibachii Nc14]
MVFDASSSRRQVTKLFTSSKISSLSFLNDVLPIQTDFVESIRSEFTLRACQFPLVVTGSCDQGTQNDIAIHSLVQNLSDEIEANSLCSRTEDDLQLFEVASCAHAGDVNALRFIVSQNTHAILSASSDGSVYLFRLSDIRTEDNEQRLIKTPILQWESIFETAITCLDASIHSSCAVIGSEMGQLAWIQLDNSTSTTKIDNTHATCLPTFDLKMLRCDNVVATIGASPDQQLQIWDIKANKNFPVLSAGNGNTSLISLELHPTRPEILLTGSSDGSISFWDQRHLSAPFYVDAKKHTKAVNALRIHPESPQHLFSAGDDKDLLHWEVEYDHLDANVVSTNEPTQPMKKANMSGVNKVASNFLPWTSIDIHSESDTLLAGSEAQSITVVQNCSSTMQHI